MAISSNFSYLTDLIRHAELTPETVAQFRAKAVEAVDGAVDTFFKPEREVAEGREAYDKLTDVESALRAYKGRIAKDVEANAARRQEMGEKARVNYPAHTDQVVNEPSVTTYRKQTITKGTRTFSEARVDQPQSATAENLSSRLTQLAEKMGSVLPLYGSVAMVPGPLSVSLKDHLKQTLEWKFKGQSSSQHTLEQDSFRLLTLSASKKTVSGGSSSSSNGEGKVEQVTVDERVLPQLCQIRESLDSLGYVAPKSGEQSFTQLVTETDTRSETHGFFNKTTTEYPFEVGSSYRSAGQQTVPTDPAAMGVGFAPTNKGLKPTPGAEILDLVEGSQELTTELVDQLRDKSRSVLNQAIDTLFKTDREVNEGRQAYDQLNNLGRALKLAASRWPEPKIVRDSYYDRDRAPHLTALQTQMKNLSEVLPLYTCVAMVPGEMSSSVKNYAKELATFNVASSFGGSSTSQAVSGSLLTLGMSETTEHSSFGGSFNGNSKFETTTTDERIMPKLHELRVKLDQLHASNGVLTLEQ